MRAPNESDETRALTPRQVRLRLHDARYSPIPVKGKIPEGEAWQTKDTTNPAEIALCETVWPYGLNTGCLTRILPVFDVDVLDEAAAEAAEALIRERLGERGRLTVRIGKSPKRAIPLRTDTPFKKIKIKFETPKDAPEQAIEVLCDGQQFVVHGIHPDTGQPYRWPDGALWEVPYDKLPVIAESEARQLAEDVVQLLVKNHGYSLAKKQEDKEPRKARKSDGRAEPVDKVIRALAVVPNDESVDEEKWFRITASVWHGTRGDNRALTALHEWSSQSPKYDAKRTDQRWSAFFRDPPKEITIATLYAYANAFRPGWAREYEAERRGTERISIILSGGDLPLVVREMATAIAADSKGTLLFQREGSLCRLGCREIGPTEKDLIWRPRNALEIVGVDKHWLRRRAMEAVKFLKYDSFTAQCFEVNLELEYAEALASSSDIWPFKELVGTIEAPTLRPDGSVLIRPGYDEETDLYFDPGTTEFPSVPERPSRIDALKAIEILEELIAEFPFVKGEGETATVCASKSVILSELLTGAVRRTLRTAPLHLHDAPEMGTGKSLLASLASIIYTGRSAVPISYTGNEEEDRKRITACLLAGDAFVLLDNVNTIMRSAAFSSVLTEDTWKDRILGKSKNTTALPTRTLWIATGNNISVTGDLVTRVIRCRIDAACERPEERGPFKIVDLRSYVKENRGRLACAALTVLKSYIDAGKPNQNIGAFGRFEEWSDLVRSALVWLGRADPCRTREDIRDSDNSIAAHGAVLTAWWDCYKDRDVKVKEIVNDAKDGQFTQYPPAEKAALATALGEVLYYGKIVPRNLGFWLRMHRDRIVGGLALRQAKKDERHGATWFVEAVGGGRGALSRMGW
jgi:putative DNA primase/helicase